MSSFMTEILRRPHWLPCLSRLLAASVWPGLQMMSKVLPAPLSTPLAPGLPLVHSHRSQVSFDEQWKSRRFLRLQPVMASHCTWNASRVLSTAYKALCGLALAFLVLAHLTPLPTQRNWHCCPHCMETLPPCLFFCNPYPRTRSHWWERERDWACNLGICPEWKSNPGPFRAQDGAPPNCATLTRAPRYLYLLASPRAASSGNAPFSARPS